MSRNNKIVTYFLASLVVVAFLVVTTVLLFPKGKVVGVVGEDFVPVVIDHPVSMMDSQMDEVLGVTVIVGGDVMLARTIEPKLIRGGFDPFKNLRKVFLEADFVVTNLEYVAAEGGTQNSFKPYTFRAGPRTLDYLRDVGVDLVSLANNHAGDYGVSGFVQMLNNLKDKSIAYVGGGMNANRAYAPVYVNLKGVEFAFVAFNAIETPYFVATSNRAGNAWINQARLKSAIMQADDNADVVVVLPHWGSEYTAKVNSQQVSLGRKAVDWGADLVIGGHPHHIQRSERYKGGEIFYSMGNLVFDGPGPAGWNDGYMVEVSVDEQGQISTSKIFYRTSDTGVVTLK